MAGEELRLLGRESGGPDYRQLRVPQDQLHSAVREAAHAGRLAPLAELGEALFEVSQMPVDAERAARIRVPEDVEVLVARERARLVVQALHQPVEELAHADRLAKVPRGASGFRASWGLTSGRPMRLRDAA